MLADIDPFNSEDSIRTYENINNKMLSLNNIGPKIFEHLIIRFSYRRRIKNKKRKEEKIWILSIGRLAFFKLVFQ